MIRIVPRFRLVHNVIRDAITIQECEVFGRPGLQEPEHCLALCANSIDLLAATVNARNTAEVTTRSIVGTISLPTLGSFYQQLVCLGLYRRH